MTRRKHNQTLDAVQETAKGHAAGMMTDESLDEISRVVRRRGRPPGSFTDRIATIPPVRCTPEQRRRFEILGGPDWLRAQLDREIQEHPDTDLVDDIRARVEPLGGIELELPPRDPPRDPPDFG